MSILSMAVVTNKKPTEDFVKTFVAKNFSKNLWKMLKKYQPDHIDNGDVKMSDLPLMEPGKWIKQTVTKWSDALPITDDVAQVCTQNCGKMSRIRLWLQAKPARLYQQLFQPNQIDMCRADYWGILPSYLNEVDKKRYNNLKGIKDKDGDKKVAAKPKASAKKD